MKELAKNISVNASRMEKGLSNKGNRVYLKNGKNVKMPRLPLGRENGPWLGWRGELDQMIWGSFGRVRDFYCSQRAIEELESIFTFEISFWQLYGECGLRVNRGSGESSWKLLQSPGCKWLWLGLPWWLCRRRAWLRGRYTLEAGSPGLGDGWTQGVRGGTGLRMGLRFPTHACELCLHFTRQTRPADSPVLTSLPFTLWITTAFLSSYFQYQGVYLLTSFICMVSNHLSPATLPVFCVVSLSLLASFCHVPSSLLLLASSFAYTTNSKFYILWNKVDSCDLGPVAWPPCASVSWYAQWK